MIATSEIKNFWAAFAAETGPAVSDIQSGNTSSFASRFEKLSAQLARLAPGLFLEWEAKPGYVEIIVTARGVLRHFAQARTIAAAAPQIPGWRIRALRTCKPVPSMLVLNGAELPASRMRAHVINLMGRYGLVFLINGVEITDYVLFRNQGHRIIMDIIGEERFGLYVTDVQVMSHADWDNNGGESSFPLDDLIEIIPAAPVHLIQPATPVLEVIHDSRRVA